MCGECVDDFHADVLFMFEFDTNTRQNIIICVHYICVLDHTESQGHNYIDQRENSSTDSQCHPDLHKH